MPKRVAGASSLVQRRQGRHGGATEDRFGAVLGPLAYQSSLMVSLFAARGPRGLASEASTLRKL